MVSGVVPHNKSIFIWSNSVALRTAPLERTCWWHLLHSEGERKGVVGLSNQHRATHEVYSGSWMDRPLLFLEQYSMDVVKCTNPHGFSPSWHLQDLTEATANVQMGWPSSHTLTAESWYGMQYRRISPQQYHRNCHYSCMNSRGDKRSKEI